MATTITNMHFSSAESETEGGLTALQRKVLYRLLVNQEVITRDGQHDYDLVAGLDLHPAQSREIVATVRQLVEMRLATRTRRIVTQQPSGAFGAGRWREVVVAQTDGFFYRPVVDVDEAPLPISHEALGRPVLAWLYVYGRLEYDETVADGEEGYKSRINEPLGEPESMALELRNDALALMREQVVCGWSERQPPRGAGGHTQRHGLIETHVILELNK